MSASLTLGSNRIVHVAAVLVAMMGCGLLLLFCAANFAMEVSYADKVLRVTFITLPCLLVGAVAWGIRSRVSLKVLSGITAVVVVALVYLGWDRSAASVPQAPAWPKVASSASQTYLAYQWFVPNSPQSRLESGPSTRPDLPNPSPKPEEWAAFATKHRAAIEAAWTSDTVGREWIEILATKSPDGLFPVVDANTPIVSFRRVRQVLITRWGIAHLRLLDGHRDEAAQVLLPVLRAFYHLQQVSTTLVDQMISVVALNGTYQRLELINAEGLLSPAVQAEVAETLKSSPSAQVTLHNAYLGEATFARLGFSHVRDDPGWLERMTKQSVTVRSLLSIPGFGRILLNANETEQEWSTYLRETFRGGENRDFQSIHDQAEQLTLRTDRWRIKNPAGRRMLYAVLPSFEKVFENFWKSEDRRVALLQKLQT